MPPKLTDDQLTSEIIVRKEMDIDDEEKDNTSQFVKEDDDGWTKM
jgi:hypothetical protein